MFICSLRSFGQVEPVDTPAIQEVQVFSEHVVIRKINITGNKHTKRSIILREMSIGEGSIVSADSLYELTELNRKRLWNLSLFTDVIVTFERISDSTIDWNIKLKEQWYIIPELAFKLADRNFNVWWTEQNRDIRRANIGVNVKHRNFR